MLVLLLAVVSSCSSKPQCNVDNDCGPARACVKEMCLDRRVRTLAFEITPPMDSHAAQTEIVDQTSMFTVDRKVSVQGTVARPVPDLGLFASEAHVIITIPSLIQGREAFRVQTEMADFGFGFAIGEGRLGAQATLTFSPGSGATNQPPIPLMAPLAATIGLSFPTSEQVTSLPGFLHDASDQPLKDYQVRAFVGSTLVSNWSTTDTMGHFVPSVPPSAVPPGSTSSIVLTMDLMDDAKNVPHYVSQPFLPSPALKDHTYVMPAFTPPTLPTTFEVQTVDGTQSGVTVLFRAEIPGLPDGTAIYQKSAESDENGIVQVSLIADGLGNALPYQVVVQPLNVPHYLFASLCVPAMPIDLPQSEDQAPFPLRLNNRLALNGVVRGKASSGPDVPVVGATVIATQIFVNSPCADAVPAIPASTITDSTGYYLLLVDPGTYRIDVIPPTSSPWPRLTEDGDAVVVVGETAVPVHDVALPKGEVFDGNVVDADGAPLPGATVKVFEVACRTAACTSAGPPNLLAEVVTDGVTEGDKVIGHFRAVLPPL